MGHVTFRLAGAGDLDTLLALHDQYAVADGHEVDLARARAGFAPLLDDIDRAGRGVVWLAEEAGPAIGYAVVTWGWSIESGGPEALLDEIYVARPGRGVGQRLVAHLVEDCRRRGFRRIFLETERRNARARALYARLGFVEEDSVWMSRDLEP